MKWRRERLTNVRFLGLVCLWLVLPLRAWPQGPDPAYYFHPATELSWAQCYVWMEGGSRMKIPFIPVVVTGFRRAPMGIGSYSRDVKVDGPVVFIGDGIVKEGVWNSYKGRKKDYTSGDIDVAGKVVLFSCDFPDKLQEVTKEDVPLSARIAEAASRRAAAVLVFSHKGSGSFLTVDYEKESDIPDIPVISISEKSFLDILLCDFDVDGESILKEWEESGTPPDGVELSAKIHLEMEGNFTKAETENFAILFRREMFSEQEMQESVKVNERALQFLFDCFKEDKELQWKHLNSVYFRDFDSKFFYTHHWGWGLAGEEGVFMVYRGGVPDFGMAVHENTHILTRLNWGESTSFINEGLGKYTEALATDKDKNHLAVIQFLKEGQLFPLKDMVNFYIGPSGLKTLVGYPASGSFIAFLMDRYGLQSVKKLTRLEGRTSQEKEKRDSWTEAIGEPLSKLEKEWLYWLKERYQVEEKFILEHLEKSSETREFFQVDPKILDSYVGQYSFSSNILTVTKEDNQLFLEVPGMGKVKLIPESETQFEVQAFDAPIRFVMNEQGEVTHMIIQAGGGEIRADRIK